MQLIVYEICAEKAGCKKIHSIKTVNGLKAVKSEEKKGKE